MKLRFLGKNSTPGDSPTLYATDRDSYIVQGWKVYANDLLTRLDVPAATRPWKCRPSCSNIWSTTA
ncbi:hypothetical protein ACFQ2B_03385 [Streptomyces stramineus]